MVERDKVDALVGEISSASGLAISQVATRAKTLFMQTGCNSDELRGKNCSRYMFHLEACNTMYVRTIGQALLRDGMRSEEHTSELQSLMRISYAVFCLKKKKQHE